MTQSDHPTETRDHWSSRLGFIIATVGSAVGLGNIWKFPYIVGSSGGAAFIAIYLICIGLVGFPILISEWLVGRRGHHNPISSVIQIAKEDRASPMWGVVGGIGVFSSFVVLSFYSVIGGWTLQYIINAVSGDFHELTKASSTAMFSGMLSSPMQLLLNHTGFMLFTVLIVAFGVGQGIEKASKFLMPALFVILVAMVIYAIQSPGFDQAFEFLFSPKWDKLSSESVLTALGHAFFTLSLGMGVMISYGSFLNEDVNLIKTGVLVVGLDTAIALGAGLAIFPIVFSSGLDATSGPGLLFEALPIAFGSLPGGQILGIAFFVLLCFAALTSSISLLEPSVELLEEKFKFSRRSSSLLAGIGVWALGILSILSMNVLKDFTIFGKNFFDFFDFITSNLSMPLGGMLIVIFCGWIMNQEKVQEQFKFGKTGMASWRIIAHYAAPIAVLIVFLHGLGAFNFIKNLF